MTYGWGGRLVFRANLYKLKVKFCRVGANFMILKSKKDILDPNPSATSRALRRAEANSEKDCGSVNLS